MLRKLILVLSLAAASTSTLAQQFIQLGSMNEDKHYILRPSEGIRMGRGVIITLATEKENLAFAENRYFSCDGRLISGSFGSSVSFESTQEKRFNEMAREILDARSIPSPYSVDLFPYDESDLITKSRIRPQLRDLCAKAKPERKGLLYPFFESRRNKEGEFHVSHLMAGYINRKNEQVEGWIKEYQASEKVITRPDGSQVTDRNGEPLKYPRVKEDKSNTLLKVVVDCKNNMFAITSMTKYSSQGDPKSVRDDRRPSFSDPIPESKGETFVTNLCQMY
jgi:hypothetical protein